MEEVVALPIAAYGDGDEDEVEGSPSRKYDDDTFDVDLLRQLLEFPPETIARNFNDIYDELDQARRFLEAFFNSAARKPEMFLAIVNRNNGEVAFMLHWFATEVRLKTSDPSRSHQSYNNFKARLKEKSAVEEQAFGEVYDAFQVFTGDDTQPISEATKLYDEQLKYLATDFQPIPLDLRTESCDDSYVAAKKTEFRNYVIEQTRARCLVDLPHDDAVSDAASEF